MSAPFYVEVLTRNGEVRQRQRVDALPIRIGRSYDNDVILDDKHTSPHHVVIERNEAGELEAHDQASRNGVMHKGKRSARLPLAGNTVFRLGHTNLRVRSADFSVANEMRDTTIHAWEGWPPALTGLLLLALLSLFSSWLSDTDKQETIRYITMMMVFLCLGLLWSGGWTLANRIFSGQTRFGRHLFIMASGLVVMELLAQVLSPIAYALSLASLSRYGNHVFFVVGAVIVYFHLVTISANHARRQAIICVILMLLGSGLTLAFNYQNSGSFSEELYMSELYPPSLRLSPDHTVDEFLGKSMRLKADIDAERVTLFSDEGDTGADESD